MDRRILMLVGVLGALAVMVGAFGAHGLKSWAATLSDGGDRLAWWDTATDYFFWSLPLLVGLSVVAPRAPHRPVVVGVALTLAGLLLFCGSLYVMALTGVRALGAITPLGGVAFIAAWIALAVAAFRSR